MSDGRSGGAGTAIERVFVVVIGDISVVQESTEAHYISSHFASEYDTHIFGPLSKRIPGATIHSFPFDGVSGVFLLNALFVPYWIYVSLRYRPDVVYCYSSVLTPPLIASALTGATTVHDIQKDPYEQLREFTQRRDVSRPPGFGLVPLIAKVAHRLVLPRSDEIITLSEPLKRQVVENFHVPRERIHVVPLGVDTTLFTPTETEAGARLRVVYIGTITSYRGINHVIDAIRQLADRYRSRITFDIYGHGDEEFLEEIAALADADDTDYEISLEGHVDHRELPKIVSQYDVAVSPLPPLEAFQVSCPTKVFEYLAMGLPVIATRITPHERYLTHRENAFLVEPEDPSANAAVFEEILDDRELLRRMSEAARESSLEHDWQQRYDAIEGVIQRTHHGESLAA